MSILLAIHVDFTDLSGLPMGLLLHHLSTYSGPVSDEMTLRPVFTQHGIYLT
jgi:hypothetical protein